MCACLAPVSQALSPPKPELDLIVLKLWRLLWFWAWGAECCADDGTTPPPIPPLVGPHPAVLLWSDSQYCAVSHGEEIIPLWSDQALAGTVRVVREEMHRYPHVEGRGKTDWQRGKWDKEQQKCCSKEIHSACPFWFPNSPVLQHYPIPFCPSSLCPPALGLCRSQRR